MTFTWNPKQSYALECRSPFVDIEGGVGAGKTTPLLGKVVMLVLQHPGIHCFLGRWTEDALNTQLKPAWRDFAAKCGLTLVWHPDEEYDEVVGMGARVYLRGLRTSETVSKYQKLRGLNLTFIGIDQAEELPADFFKELIGRLRQIGFDGLKQIWLVCQPVNEDHWIAKDFPTDNSRIGHTYIHTNVYDNVANVGQEFIDLMESKYPEGSSERRTLLLGHRGLANAGEAVYGGYFSRQVHERPCVMVSTVEVVESWDWGHKHPCVSWRQYLPSGVCQVLGAVMGENMFLEDFVPAALVYRAQWCPRALRFNTTGDPAGLDQTNQGVQVSKIRDILASHDIYPVTRSDANRPDVRYQAIQQQAARMRRLAFGGQPAFQLNPRCIVLTQEGPRTASFTVDGYEAGYIWGDRAVIGRQTVRIPKKDGYYDHFQNTCEYAEMSSGAPSQSTVEEIARAERVAVKDQQRDPVDRRLSSPLRTHRQRGGY